MWDSTFREPARWPRRLGRLVFIKGSQHSHRQTERFYNSRCTYGNDIVVEQWLKEEEHFTDSDVFDILFTDTLFDYHDESVDYDTAVKKCRGRYPVLKSFLN